MKNKRGPQNVEINAFPDIVYLSNVPRAVPPGKLVVHNSVRATPKATPGTLGFRAWLAPPSAQYVTCSCDWAAHLGKHYRVRRIGDDDEA